MYFLICQRKQTALCCGCLYNSFSVRRRLRKEHKFRSLSEGVLQILAEVSEESIAQLLGGPSSKSGAIMVVFDEKKELRKKEVTCIWVRHQ